MPVPSYRLLRGYAFDPSYSTRLDTFWSNEVLYKIPWEENLLPGPVGEYVEIVDYDPASNCFYEPVDLNHIHILAEQGLQPSEGCPQFHQQLVYAVVMKVIVHFEKAMGRPILWAPQRFKPGQNGAPDEAESYVPRLRIYPHGLRQENAYYSPAKKALLFGYFQASEYWNGTNVPGTAVFTCLSPDIVAHETTHAILDGIHPRYGEDTNPDVLAFHEGFADIVALLNRFTFKEVVVSQLALSKGSFRNAYNSLGELATQFGQAVGKHRKSLRSAIGEWDEQKGSWQPHEPDPGALAKTLEPHDRGALLVAAVYDAFISLYSHRTQDLTRLATNGTGLLQPGALPIDLLNRLASEACEIASHLLDVCIRALDYCPPVDITFGDYLRAMVTADFEFAPEDEQGYRLALLEAFRRRGIVPHDVNTFSSASLKWDGLRDNEMQNQSFQKLIKMLLDGSKQNTGILDQIFRLSNEKSREQIFSDSRELRAMLHGFIAKNLDNEGLAILGLQKPKQPISYKVSYQTESGLIKKNFQVKAPPIEIHMLRPAIRFSKGGFVQKQLLISLTQSLWIDPVKLDLEGLSERIRYRGGSTLVIDLDAKELKYSIIKNIASSTRLCQQLNKQVEISDLEVSFVKSFLQREDEPFAFLHMQH